MKVTRTLVRTMDEAKPLLSLLRSKDRAGWDTESSGPVLEYGTKKRKMLNMHRSITTGASFAFRLANDTISSFYVPLAHNEGNASLAVQKAVLDALLEREGESWAHHLKHELHALQRAKETRDNVWFRCSLLGAWLVGLRSDQSKNPFGLKALAATHLGMDMASFEETFGKRQVCEVKPEECLDYVTDDAVAALLLGEMVSPLLTKYKQWDVFLNQELPFARVALDIEIRGMPFDSDAARALGNRLQVQAWDLEERWRKLVPGVKITSPKEISDFFYGAVKYVEIDGKGKLVQAEKNPLWSVEALEPTKKGKKAPVNADALETHSLRCKGFAQKAAKLLLEHRVIDKLITTYAFGLPALAAQYEDGRLHPSILQHGTRTGRIAMATPNLMNIPVRTELGQLVKALFVATEGYEIINADYSQIELRVLAHLSQDPLLIKVYQDGGDVHQQTADYVGCDRKGAKTVNFAKIYGAGNAKLGRKIGCSEEQAGKYMDKYLAKYVGIAAFLDEAVVRAKSRGYAKTLGGRIRLLPLLRKQPSNKAERKARGSAERMARNTPIQGSAGDIVKQAMIRLFAQGARIVNQVHDSIVLEERKEDVEARCALLKDTMENVVKLRVPLVVDMEHGEVWAK